MHWFQCCLTRRSSSSSGRWSRTGSRSRASPRDASRARHALFFWRLQSLPRSCTVHLYSLTGVIAVAEPHDESGGREDHVSRAAQLLDRPATGTSVLHNSPASASASASASHSFCFSMSTSSSQHSRLTHALSLVFWCSPQADLVHLGARFTPCMRRDPQIESRFRRCREKEGLNSGCCVYNDGSGCFQSLKHNCSV